MVTAKLLRLAGAVLAGSLVLGACTGGDDAPEPTSSTAAPDVPGDLEVPEGVELTGAGTRLDAGSPATVAWQSEGAEATAVDVTVRRIRTGSLKHFRFFSLDEATKGMRPYYVDVVVKNRGPAAIKNAQVPLLARDTGNTLTQPTRIVGEVHPCRGNALPVSLPVDRTAKACLVYLVPNEVRLESVDLVTGEQADAVRWTPAS